MNCYCLIHDLQYSIFRRISTIRVTNNYTSYDCRVVLIGKKLIEDNRTERSLINKSSVPLGESFM